MRVEHLSADNAGRLNPVYTREQAWELLHKYNRESFHIQHAETVEAVMRYFAGELGYAGEADFWGLVGLLHDLDFEEFPDQHCIKVQEILAEEGVDAEIERAIVSHTYGIHVDVKPEHTMEKILFIHFLSDSGMSDKGHLNMFVLPANKLIQQKIKAAG